MFRFLVPNFAPWMIVSWAGTKYKDAVRGRGAESVLAFENHVRFREYERGTETDSFPRISRSYAFNAFLGGRYVTERPPKHLDHYGNHKYLLSIRGSTLPKWAPKMRDRHNTDIS